LLEVRQPRAANPGGIETEPQRFGRSDRRTISAWTCIRKHPRNKSVSRALIRVSSCSIKVIRARCGPQRLLKTDSRPVRPGGKERCWPFRCVVVLQDAVGRPLGQLATSLIICITNKQGHRSALIRLARRATMSNGTRNNHSENVWTSCRARARCANRGRSAATGWVGARSGRFEQRSREGQGRENTASSCARSPNWLIGPVKSRRGHTGKNGGTVLLPELEQEYHRRTIGTGRTC